MGLYSSYEPKCSSYEVVKGTVKEPFRNSNSS